VVVENQRITMK